MDICEILKSMPFKEIMGSLVGAWAGAKFAFMYDKSLKVKEDTDKEAELVRYVQFVLISHIHMVSNIWSQYLKAEFSNSNRHLNLKKFNFNDVPTLYFEKLSFLLRKYKPNIIYILFIHERNYFNFIGSLKDRNEYYQKNEEELPRSSERQEVIKEFTDRIYEFYSKIDESNQDAFRALHEYAIEKYPDYKFLNLEELTKNQTSPS